MIFDYLLWIQHAGAIVPSCGAGIMRGGHAFGQQKEKIRPAYAGALGRPFSASDGVNLNSVDMDEATATT